MISTPAGPTIRVFKGGVSLTTKLLLWTPSNSHFSHSFNSAVILFCQSVFYLTFDCVVRLATMFVKSRDQNRKRLKTQQVNYVFHKSQQCENILTQNL